MKISRLIGLALLLAAFPASAVAQRVESRLMTNYVAQDVLEDAVRKEGWTHIPLIVRWEVRKGDTIRIWAGGMIDRGGDLPGANATGPQGLAAGQQAPKVTFALSDKPEHAWCLLAKGEGKDIYKCQPEGKALEIKVAKNNEKLFLAFNDEKGRYGDNHLGEGRRHEFRPLWVRIELVREGD